MKPLRASSSKVAVCVAAWALGGCQAPLAITIGQPHSILVETEGDTAPAVQIAIPVAVMGAQSVSLQRDGTTVATLNPTQATPSVWLPGGVDLWDESAPYGTSLDYRVVAASGNTVDSKDVTVPLVRSLTAFPEITFPPDGSSGQGTQPTLDWTPVGVPQANPLAEYRVNAQYLDNPQVPEMSFFVGPDQDTFDWKLPATSSAGQVVIPPPLTPGVRVELQVVAIASSSVETEETISKPVVFEP